MVVQIPMKNSEGKSKDCGSVIRIGSLQYYYYYFLSKTLLLLLFLVLGLREKRGSHLILAIDREK